VRARQVGFVGGRLCAEQALALLGLPACGVPRGDAGEPLWPHGIAGSITHTDVAAHALVLRGAGCAGVGIDSQAVVDAQAGADVASLCCSPAERAAWLHGTDALLRTTVLFAAKEAFYKAAFPIVRRFIDFDEAEAVRWDAANGTVTLRADARLAPARPEFVAHYRVEAAVVHASLLLDEASAGGLRPAG
jgi:enterobactin synthetase component D